MTAEAPLTDEDRAAIERIRPKARTLERITLEAIAQHFLAAGAARERARQAAPAPDALIARLHRLPPPETDRSLPQECAAALAALTAERDEAQHWRGDFMLACEQRDKAEAALAAALECVKAADAWAYGGEPDTVLEGRYDNVRAKHHEVIDAAIRASAKDGRD